jgi:hydrogenase/urease accessory protein HupE
VVSCGGRPMPLVSAATQRDNQGGVHFQLTFSEARQGELIIHSALLDELPHGHRQFLSVRDEKGNLLSEQMLDATHSTSTLDCVPAFQTTVARHSVREFLVLGVMHIATGYDHLLFLLGLLLVGGTLRSALQIITSFTCAHSITLALATLNVIHISPRIVEPLIAASIVYVGLENLLRPAVKGRWRLTFAFGLIHGCGFASALRELGVGTNGLGIVTPLLSFNLGVELGQLTIAALVLPVIWKFRASPVLVQRVAPIGSALIVIAGSCWLVQRTLF